MGHFLWSLLFLPCTLQECHTVLISVYPTLSSFYSWCFSTILRHLRIQINLGSVLSSINISKWFLKVEIVLNLEIMRCNMAWWIQTQFRNQMLRTKRMALRLSNLWSLTSQWITFLTGKIRVIIQCIRKVGN